MGIAFLWLEISYHLCISFGNYVYKVIICVHTKKNICLSYM